MYFSELTHEQVKMKGKHSEDGWACSDQLFPGIQSMAAAAGMLMLGRLPFREMELRWTGDGHLSLQTTSFNCISSKVPPASKQLPRAAFICSSAAPVLTMRATAGSILTKPSFGFH